MIRRPPISTRTDTLFPDTPRFRSWPQGPRVERHLLVKRARMQGFVIFDHMDRYEDSVALLADWVRSGQLVYEEDALEGIDACPDALAGLYRGENRGKRIIRMEERRVGNECGSMSRDRWSQTQYNKTLLTIAHLN